MAIDPTCGMTVDEATALQAEHNGQKFYFCCDGCRQTFLAKNVPLNPVNLGDGGCAEIGIKHDDHAAEEHSCCRGHNAATTAPAVAAKFFCPMCPDVESDKPGDCRKC